MHESCAVYQKMSQFKLHFNHITAKLKHRKEKFCPVLTQLGHSNMRSSLCNLLSISVFRN